MWYHLSPHLPLNDQILAPIAVRDDFGGFTEPCICVTPSIAQSLVAIGDFYNYGKYGVFRAEGAPLPADVFDYRFTQEHRFYSETAFTYIGDIYIDSIPYYDLSGLSDEEILENMQKVLDYLSQYPITPVIDALLWASCDDGDADLFHTLLKDRS